jgi:hypothetical protein
MQAAHDYFTRAAHAESERLPVGSTSLAEQLAALNELHTFVVEWMHTFRRRFRHGRASLLTSLNAGSLKATLENLTYQGPMKIELPFGDYAKADGENISFNVALPTSAFSNKHSVLRDALHVLLGDVAAADREYWARTSVKGQHRSSAGASRNDNSSGDGCHFLLRRDELHVETEEDSVAVGNVEVLSFCCQRKNYL